MVEVILRSADEREILTQLARYNSNGTVRVLGGDALQDVDMAVFSGEDPSIHAWHKQQGRPVAEDVTAGDAIAALRLVPAERIRLDDTEVRLIEAARDRGETWRSLAEKLGYRTPQALQQRYRRIGGRRSWPASGTTPQQLSSEA